MHWHCAPASFPLSSSLETFFGSEIGKCPAIDLGDCEFILHADRAEYLPIRVIRGKSV